MFKLLGSLVLKSGVDYLHIFFSFYIKMLWNFWCYEWALFTENNWNYNLDGRVSNWRIEIYFLETVIFFFFRNQQGQHAKPVNVWFDRLDRYCSAIKNSQAIKYLTPIWMQRLTLASFWFPLFLKEVACKMQIQMHFILTGCQYKANLWP